MRWKWEDGFIEEAVVTEQKIKVSNSRFVCSDGGNISRLYIRLWTVRNTRLFVTINMFQCEKCSSFFAMEDGTHNLIPLEVRRKKNGGKK